MSMFWRDSADGRVCMVCFGDLDHHTAAKDSEGLWDIHAGDCARQAGISEVPEHRWGSFIDHLYCLRCGSRFDGPRDAAPSAPCPGPRRIGAIASDRRTAPPVGC